MTQPQAHLRSLYRSILRELPSRPLTTPPSPLRSRIRACFTEPAPDPSPEYSLRQRQQAEQFIQYVKAQRNYITLLERYNPGMTMDDEDRIRLTARRVGMNLPIEFQMGKQSGDATGQPTDIDERIPPTNDQQSALEGSEDSVDIPEAASSSPKRPMKIPVNFDDSSISITTPPPQSRLQPHHHLQPPFPDPNTEIQSSPQRPPTHRSTMKGSRQSFGIALGGNNDRPNTPTVVKKVVFGERSRGVDVDGLESSFSMRSGSSNQDSVTGAVEMQLERELAVNERGMRIMGTRRKR